MNHKDIETILLFQLDRTSRKSKIFTQRTFDEQGLGINVDQWVLLKIVDETGPLSQKQLADKASRDPSSITRSLDLLEKKELLVRSPIPDNRRQYNIVLTKKGKAFIDKNMETVQNHRKLSMQGFTEEEQKTLLQMLQKIQRNMS